MRILLDARLYGLENAGLGRYIINLIGQLSKIDHKNDYVILLRKKYYNKLNLPSNWKKVIADFRHYSLNEQIKLPEIIKRESPDLVHFPHFNVPVFYRGKFVVTIHDMLMHDFAGLSATTLPAPFYFLKQLVYKFVFKRAVLKSSKIIAPSQSVKDKIVDYYNIDPNKVAITYEGFDPKIGNKSPKIESQYFVYAGNAYPHKNILKLIEATILLNKSSNKNIILVIASARNIFTERLKMEIKKLNADKFVRLLGFVPDDQLGGLFKNSIGFIFPSLSEGFGLPGLEAISSGTLLAASDIPVFREIYGDAATYFDPSDPSSIAKSLLKISNLDRTNREQRIKVGKSIVQKYSWAKMARETLKIYETESSDSIRQSQ